MSKSIYKNTNNTNNINVVHTDGGVVSQNQNTLGVQNSGVDIAKRRFNPKKIEDLYYDYKRQRLKSRELRKEVEKQEGVTFKPQLFENHISELYAPKQNFYERNDKLLEDKKIKTEILKSQQYSYNQNQRKYDKNEQEEINRNIYERLYKPGMEKMLIKGDMQKNKFTKKYYRQEEENEEEMMNNMNMNMNMQQDNDMNMHQDMQDNNNMNIQQNVENTSPNSNSNNNMQNQNKQNNNVINEENAHSEKSSKSHLNK